MNLLFPAITAVVFLLYILAIGHAWRGILQKLMVVSLPRWAWVVLGWFTTLLVSSFFVSITLVFYRLTPGTIWLALVVSGLVTSIISRGLKKMSPVAPVSTESEQSLPIIWQTIFFALLGGAFYLLALSGTDRVLWSPWQTIHELYLPVMFLVTFAILVMLVKFRASSALLGCIVAFSFLIHAYLPLSHTLPWGGDVWRHLAVEGRLSNGELYPPVLFGPEAKTRLVVGLQIPEVFLIPQKYSYGQLWGLTVLIEKTLSVPLITINTWLLPVLWSFVFPIILYGIGQLLFSSKKLALWLALAANIPFAMQVVGALTLPVSLGYLTFFFVLFLWVNALESDQKHARSFACGFSLFMIFGYFLHALMILLMSIFFWIQRQIQGKQNKILLSLGLVTALLIIPIFDIAVGKSLLPASFDLVSTIKHVIGELTGWYFARPPQPGDTVVGNIVFNDASTLSFVPTLFTRWRWPALLVMLGSWGCLLYGTVRQWFAPIRAWQAMSFLTLLTVGGYIMGWYGLVGDRLLTRRLDVMMAFCFLIWIIFVLKECLPYFLRWSSRVQKSVVLVGIIFLAWTFILAYASGPDMRTMGQSEFAAAQMIAGIDIVQPEYRCVVADTWLLLALEGLSRGGIVGGGFPIDYQFGQPERVTLYEAMKKKPTAEILAEAARLTKQPGCWVVLPSDTTAENVQKVTEITGDAPQRVGTLFLWSPW